MTEPSIIPANFRVPWNVKHRWLLCAVVDGKSIPISALRGVPGQMQVEYGAMNTELEVLKTIPRSVGLDWMQESVEHLRYLCSQE